MSHAGWHIINSAAIPIHWNRRGVGCKRSSTADTLLSVYATGFRIMDEMALVYYYEIAIVSRVVSVFI